MGVERADALRGIRTRDSVGASPREPLRGKTVRSNLTQLVSAIWSTTSVMF